MYPYISVFGKDLPTYGLISLVGILLSGTFAEHQAVKNGEHPFNMIEALCIGALGSLIGSHLLYAITNLDKIGIWSIWDVLGGSVFYGGLITGLITGYWWVKRKKYRMALYTDIAAMTLPLFHGFGRIGCFFAGCCYGVPWEHGILYHSPNLSAAETVNRFPVQLLESALLFLLFFGLYFFCYRTTEKSSQAQLRRCELLRGKLLMVYLGLYAVLRFLDEFLRGDAIRGHLGPFSTSQWISLLIVGIIVIRCLKDRRRQAIS